MRSVSALAYPVALLAAAAFSAGIPLQHRSATQAPNTRALGAGQLRSFVRATLANRWYLAALGVDAAGFGLHALALHWGALAVVQPLLVANVIFALPANHWLRHEPISKRELAWGGAVTAGLAGFVLIATAGTTPAPQPADRGPAVIAGILAILIAGSLVLLSRQARASTAATLLGIATGVVFAFNATLLKACTRVLAGHGMVGLFTSWQLYLLVTVGISGLLLNQLAYHAGPLSASLPAITVIDPLVAVLLGVSIYDDQLRHDALAVFGEAVSLIVLACSAIVLIRLEQRTPARYSNSPPQPSPGNRRLWR